MSSRYILPFADVGSGIKPSSGAKLKFFQTDGVTPKDTFSDQLATPTANANPVIADSNGVFPDIFIAGQYKHDLTDKNDVQIFGGVVITEPSTVASTNAHIDRLNPATLVIWQADTSALAGDVVTTVERSTGNGGRATGKIIVGTGTANGLNIVAHNTLSLSFSLIIEDNEISAAQVVDLVQDRSTDQTTKIIDAIGVCHDLGSGSLGDNWTGINLRIPPFTVWNYDEITQFYDGSVSSSVSSTVATLTGSPAFDVDELIGAFLWNKSDFSYATILSNTADTVTTAPLRLGTTNTYQTSDEIIISKHKVGVNIFDDSKFDWFNNGFTAQNKTYLHSDGPSTTSANEKHLVGVYHPAHIVENQTPFSEDTEKNMEARASYIFRHKNPNAASGDKVLDRFWQLSMNSDQNDAEPKTLDYIIVGGGIPFESFQGDHDGINNATVLTDTSQNWTVNRLIGATLTNVTDGSTTIITANGATTASGVLAGGSENDWDIGDEYTISGTYDRKTLYTSEMFRIASENALDRRIGLATII